jgi:methionine-S-sulfoxide reductase
MTDHSATPTEQVTLGGGCFWCVEAIFQRVEGVLKVESGYSGGTAGTANYRAVCSGATGHAEVVQITFDPALISFEEILEIFWSTHDPTTPNRQGNDVGPQYRSVIFYHTEEQRKTAERSVEQVASGLWDNPIVTEIAPFEAFFPAEAEHQNYYNNVGGRNPYCSFVITPKVAKFRKQFAHKLADARI